MNFANSSSEIFSKYTKKLFSGSNDSQKIFHHAATTKCPIERVKPGLVGKICGSLDKSNYNLLEADPITSHTIPPLSDKINQVSLEPNGGGKKQKLPLGFKI